MKKAIFVVAAMMLMSVNVYAASFDQPVPANAYISYIGYDWAWATVTLCWINWCDLDSWALDTSFIGGTVTTSPSTVGDIIALLGSTGAAGLSRLTHQS